MQCRRILGTWTWFHARWWADPRLGVSIGTRGDAAAVDQYLARFAKEFARFTDRNGDRLPREGPRLAAEGLSSRDVTIVHGDAHFWNCLVPRGVGRDDIRIFDWDSWRIGKAASDLSYMMAMHWYPDRRRRLERGLLDHYHAALVEHGVEGYGRAALDHDYRLSALWQIMVPVWQAGIDIPPVIWWNNLERIFLAVEDLNCRELLG